MKGRPMVNPDSALRSILTVSQYADVRVGGAERYLQETSGYLARCGLRSTCLHAHDLHPDAPVSPPWQLFSGGYHPAWPAQIDRLLAERQPDVVYAHLTVPGIVDVAVRRAAARGIPVCLVYHSDVTGADRLRRLVGSLYHRLIGEGTLRRAAVLVASSPQYVAASPWLAGMRHSAVHFAPPGVDAVIADGRAGIGRRFLLFVGKAGVEGKGFGVLYEAWKRLRVSAPDLDLVAIGAPPRRHYPGVEFLGQLEDRRQLADWYASAAATVLPSTTNAESFGMVLAEALVAGCPVVGSRIGGIPALIAQGENGYLAPPGDAIALADALALVLRQQPQLRTHLRLNHSAYRQWFGWEATGERVRAALLAAVAQRPGASLPGDSRFGG